MTTSLPISSVTESADSSPLSDLIAELKTCSDSSDEHRVRAAKLCLEIRSRIEQGALGPNVNWREWMRFNLSLATSNIYALLAIGRAKDPYHELARQRSLGVTRQRKYAANTLVRSRERDPNRIEAINWIKSASDENVTRILRQITAINSTKPAELRSS